MSHTRIKDQSVDAFSLPVTLLEKAKSRAAELKMTRSGFYRFCLAKMLGYSEEDSRKLAEHRAVLNSVEQALAFRESSDVPVVNSAKVRAASKAVIYKLRKPRKSGVE